MGTHKSDYAIEILKKFGWTEGKGLGKDEDGITSFIKAKLKSSYGGIGFKNSDDLTDHWWDSFYNTSANNLTVKKDNGKISIHTGDQVASRKAITNQSYSSFVSGGSLIGSKIMKSKKFKRKNKQRDCILLDPTKMAKIQNGFLNNKSAKHTRIQQHDENDRSIVKKKGVSFAKNLLSFKIFHKKKSIVTDFGRIANPANVSFKFSCLKKRSAYSPSKKMLLGQDAIPLVKSNGILSLEGQKAKKVNRNKVSLLASHKNVKIKFKKKQKLKRAKEIDTNYSKNNLKKNRKNDGHMNNGHKWFSNVATNGVGSNDYTILSKKMKRKMDRFMLKLNNRLNSERSKNITLENSSESIDHNMTKLSTKKSNKLKKKRKLNILDTNDNSLDNVSTCHKRIKLNNTNLKNINNRMANV